MPRSCPRIVFIIMCQVLVDQETSTKSLTTGRNCGEKRGVMTNFKKLSISSKLIVGNMFGKYFPT